MAILSRVSQRALWLRRRRSSSICQSLLVQELRCQGSLASTMVCGNHFEGGRLTNHRLRATIPPSK